MCSCRNAAVLTASLLWREPLSTAVGSSAGNEHSLRPQALSLLEDMAHGLQVWHCPVHTVSCHRMQNTTHNLLDRIVSEIQALLLHFADCMIGIYSPQDAQALHLPGCWNERLISSSCYMLSVVRQQEAKTLS